MEAWNIPCRRRYSAFMMEILSVSLWKLTQELHSSASGLQVHLAPLDLCKAQFIPHLLHADFLSGTHPFSSDFLWLWVPHKPHVLRCIYYYLLTLLQWKAKGTLYYFFTSWDSFLWVLSRGGSWTIIWVSRFTVLWKIKAPHPSSFAHSGLSFNAKLISKPMQSPTGNCSFPETESTAISNAGVWHHSCLSSYSSWQVTGFRGERSLFQCCVNLFCSWTWAL